MDGTQFQLWQQRREQLFPVALPKAVQDEIRERVSRMDFDHAIHSLNMYREERPYRGFYIARFAFIYQTTRQTQDRDRRQEPPALPASDIHQQAEHDRRAYQQLPETFLDDCRRRFAEWGWPEGSRQWQILCLDARAGIDVERYRCAPAFGTPSYDRAHRIAANAAARTRTDDLRTIEALRAQVLALGGTIDVLA
jgi:hypothetical protein